MSARISACIIACNEEDLLPRCLDSVAWVDEIVVVVDAKSSDRTQAIAAERATRLEVRPYEGDLEQKSYCASLASGDWLLVIDPDEVMPAALAAAIRRVAGSSDAVASGCNGYELNRRTWHLGRWLDHGDFFPDWTLRLWRSGCGEWKGHNPHARVEVSGSVGRLEPPLEHYSYRDLADQLDRIQHFSEQAARAMHARGRRVRVSDLALRPPARFLRGYLLKRGFLDGAAGFIVAAASAFHVFLKYAKLWELERRESLSEAVVQILYLTSDWKWTGPAEPMLLQLLALREQGHRVELACPAPPAGSGEGLLDEAHARGIEALLQLEAARGIRPWRDRRDAARLRALVDQEGFDVVQVWHTRAHGIALRALGKRQLGKEPLGSGKRRAVLVRAHSDGRDPARGLGSRWLFGAGADGVVCTSAGCAESHAGLRRGRATAGWLGAVDPNRFRPTPSPLRRTVRAKLGVDEAAPLVGVVARTQPQRRFDLLFEAWSRVALDRPEARLVVVGRGTHFDTVIREPLARLGLEASVVLAGHRRGEDYAALVGSLDALCFLVPGSDAGSRAVLEAAACGVPAVASRRGALPEIIDDGVTGLLCDEDSVALSGALIEVLAGGERGGRLGEAALLRAREHFVPARLATDAERFYAKLSA